jgi:hypothetical protein
MGLRIIGVDGEKIADVNGPHALPSPIGYLDSEGRFHIECSKPGEWIPLYTHDDMNRLLQRVQAAEAEARHWNSEFQRS